jgi:hypothetical protein
MPNSPTQDPAHPVHHAHHAYHAHHAHHAHPAHHAHHAHPALATFIDDVAAIQEIGWLKLVIKETLEINVKNLRTKFTTEGLIRLGPFKGPPGLIVRT